MGNKVGLEIRKKIIQNDIHLEIACLDWEHWNLQNSSKFNTVKIVESWLHVSNTGKMFFEAKELKILSW